MVLTGDVASTLDNLVLAATTNQSHVDHLMEKICQLAEKNNILGDQIKQLAKPNLILTRQGQNEKKMKKKKFTFQNWTQTGIVGLMLVGSPRVIALDTVRKINMSTRMEQRGRTL